jgi:hypothetical protein
MEVGKREKKRMREREAMERVTPQRIRKEKKCFN